MSGIYNQCLNTTTGNTTRIMISEKSTQTLELPKILEQLTKHTTFSAGAELARALHPTTILDQAVTWQQETAEARLLTENKVNFTLGGARDVREPAVQATRGIIIEAQVLLDIRQTLRRGTTVKRTVGRMKGTYPLLSDIANQIEECTELQIHRANIERKGRSAGYRQPAACHHPP